MQLDLYDESAYEVGDNNKSKINEDYFQMDLPKRSFKRNLTKLSTLASAWNRYCVSTMLMLSYPRPRWLITLSQAKLIRVKLLDHRNWETRGSNTERKGGKQSLEI